MYKIEIWQYHDLKETYENNDVKKVLRWYKSHWKDCYEYGGCAFDVYKDDVQLSFDEEYELGFH